MTSPVYQECRAQQERFRKELDDASAVLDKYPRGAMGLTPDDVKFSDAYKRDKLRADQAFQRLRNFNGWFVKTFKKEIQAERNAKYAAMSTQKEST